MKNFIYFLFALTAVSVDASDLYQLQLIEKPENSLGTTMRPQAININGDVVGFTEYQTNSNFLSWGGLDTVLLPPDPIQFLHSKD